MDFVIPAFVRGFFLGRGKPALVACTEGAHEDTCIECWEGLREGPSYEPRPSRLGLFPNPL
jgi:hypothetical protein